MDFQTAAEALYPEVENLYSEWKDDTDKLYTQFFSISASPSVSCTKGCGACCHFPIVSCTTGEAFCVLIRLLGEGKSIESISQNLKKYVDKYLDLSVQNGGIPFTNTQQKLFLDAKLPCPFFVSTGPQHQGHCGIFEQRPNICASYHTTSSPQLCAQKAPHGMVTSVVQRTDQCVEELQHLERGLFGRSALGHFPLLLYALCTEQGMNAFLREHELEAPEDGDWNSAQHIADFELYMELLKAVGYTLTSQDIHNLIEAKNIT
jgi:Fe-S-cluster containining protein